MVDRDGGLMKPVTRKTSRVHREVLEGELEESGVQRDEKRIGYPFFDMPKSSGETQEEQKPV